MEQKLRTMSQETLKLLIHLIKPMLNSSVSERRGFPLKHAFWSNYAFFAFIYGVLGCLGLCLNLYFLVVTLRDRLYKSTLQCFLIHVSCVNILQCVLILPISLVVLIARFWVFGNFMCYAVIVLQDLPSRLILLTFVLIAVHRYRQFAYNSLYTFPKEFYLIAVWALSLCLSLPACVFVDFYDIGSIFKHKTLEGLGVCVVNNHKMEEYARAMFIVLYVVPWSVIAFAFTRISIELSKHEHNSLYYTRSSLSVEICEEACLHTSSSDNLNVEGQMRIQRYLTFAVGFLFVCSLPLNSMFLIQFAVEEDDSSKSERFDILYAVLVWLSFLSTVAVPVVCLFMRKEKFVMFFSRVLNDSVSFNFEHYRKRLSTFSLSRSGTNSLTFPQLTSPPRPAPSTTTSSLAMTINNNETKVADAMVVKYSAVATTSADA